MTDTDVHVSGGEGYSKIRKMMMTFGIVLMAVLALFMVVFYFYKDVAMESMLAEYEARIILAEPAGYNTSQIEEIFQRYSSLIDTIQLTDSAAHRLGEAMINSSSDRIIISSEALLILTEMRFLTDLLGPYNTGALGLIDEISAPDSLAEGLTE